MPTHSTTSAPGKQFEHCGLVAPGSGRERMCLVDRALAHERGDDRRVETLGERDQLRLTAGPEHAAAGPQDGSLGLLEQPAPPR